MPTYEYTCKSCGENFEVFQSFSARPLRKHDACGGQLQKVFHARGVVFKGSGWYAKDSKADTSSSSSTGAENGSEKPAKAKEKSASQPAKTTTGTASSKEKSAD